MTQEQPSALTFNLEESVWLDQGERIQTILGLELEPELLIEEDEHQVSIKGGLHLFGQYVPFEQEEVFQDYEGGGKPHRIDSVRTTETGERELKHFFPIEVSIPLNRIQSVDEIYVQVDSFDYDLPEPSCIQLAADVTISGMKDVQETHQAEKTIADPPEPFPTFSHEVKIPNTESEATREADEEVEEEEYEFEEVEQEEYEFEEQTEAEETYRTNEGETFDHDSELETAADVDEELEDDHIVSEEEHEDTYAHQVEQEVDSNTSFPVRLHQREEEDSNDETRALSEAYEEALEDESAHMSHGAYREDVEDEEQEAPKAEKPVKEKKRENALYLTEMLDKGDRETFTKMKMCIIQENESLDTIAERYGLSVQQLLRWNSMDLNHVEAGEIIYIPVQVKHD
ncbi:hypothetical protein DH09_02660 [Bacillaceae bacterium JMAK1]|nr:hypothetical protein DH09_02660 [Bacillaceae bacterium JMAK1]